MATYNIKGYWMDSDKSVLDKSMTELFTVSGNFKRPTDMIHPTIQISNHPSVDWSTCNYIFIELFHRYYFVKSKTYDTFGNIEISCVVDPLTSHKNDIKRLFVIAGRSSTIYNVYQYDDEVAKLENKVVATQKFPYGFSNTDSLILAVNGTGGGVI